jgi:hypothetical protein
MSHGSTGLNTPSQKECNDKVGQFLCVQKRGALLAVVGGRMVLGVVITMVVGPRAPVDKELALAGPVLDPIKSHVDGLRSFLFDGVIRKAFRSGVVDLQGGRGL